MECIKKPFWLEDYVVRNISKKFKDFLETFNLEEESEIDLNILRKYYKKDKIKAMVLIDELAVRGFRFISNTKNHVLPEQIKDLGKNFIEFSNGEKYKKLDNSIIAFNKIIERFEISDDSFFYKIPINGFKNLNKNIESNLLIEVFNRAGFSVSNEYLFTNSIIKDKIDVKSYVVNKEKEEYREKIKDCLYRENFDLFLKYCNNNNIVYIDELIDFNFEKLNSITGFSKNKIENIKIKINHILYKKFWKRKEEERKEEERKEEERKEEERKEEERKEEERKEEERKEEEIALKKSDIYFFKDKYQEITERKEIKNNLPEERFSLFLKYCKENNIIYIDELLEFDFSKLIGIKGFRIKRIENTKESINKILLIEENNDNKSDLNNIEIEESIIKKVDIYFKEIPMNIILNEQNNLEKIVLDICKEKNIRFLEELEDIKIEYLASLYGLGKKKIEAIMENLSKFAFSIEDFIAYEYKKIRNDKNYEFNQEKVINRFTLEIMGKVNNITRERVRQRVEKSRESICRFIIIIEKYLINMNKDEYILEIDFLKEINYKKNEEIFTEEDILVICDCIKENKFKYIRYFKEIDRIIVNRNIDNDKEKIEEVLNRIPAIFELYDVLDLFLEIDIPYLGIDEIEIFLKSFGYKNINNIYSKFTFNNEKVMEFIMIKDYPKGIQLDEENLNKIEEKSKKLFNIQFKNHRSLAATIERGNTIICSPNTYINYKNIKLDMQVIYKIKDYIDEYLYNNDAVYCNTLFENFKDELISKTSVDNYRFLYGILSYFYKDEYRFKKNYIYRNAEEEISKLKILENYIFDKSVVSLKELKEELKWQEYTILQTLPLSKNILLWSPAEYKNINNINFVDNFLEKLEEIIINSLKDGYINAETLYKNNEIYFIENKIPNSIALFSVIDKFLGEKFYCKRPHILSDKNKEQFTTESLFEKVITKILETEKTFFESDVESYLSDLKLNANSFYIPFTKIKRKYVQIDKKEYCKPENFNFSNLFIENVIKVLCADLKYKNYINISDYNFGRLPEFENNIFNWNPYIIKEIVERYLFEEYKVIKNNLDLTNYTKFFMLKIDNYIENFEELLLYIVKNEYNNNENLTIPNITSFLKERNIIQKNLPKDFLEHEMIEIDDYGRITIKEGKI